jgi:hypothetical protein
MALAEYVAYFRKCGQKYQQMSVATLELGTIVAM